MIAIDIKNLSFKYSEKTVLNNINLQIKQGEHVAIIGKNGAGKTTLAKVMNGIEKYKEGSVLIEGKSIHDKSISEIARDVGYSYQNPDDQIFHNNVRKELEFGPRNLGFSRELIKKSVDRALKLCGLEEYQDEVPYNLPYSQRKFVTLASVEAMQPSILILDEPTAGQDHQGLKLLKNLLESQKDTTVVVITHDMEFVQGNFDRVLVMIDGQIISDDTSTKTFYKKDVLKRANLEAPYFIKAMDVLGVKGAVASFEEFKRYYLKNQNLEEEKI